MITPSKSIAADFFENIEWSIKRDRRGIQVYTGKVVGSSDRAVFSTMEIAASTESVVALLLDLENCKQWAAMCREARVEQRINETEAIIYSLNDIPFPVRDRDGYSSVVWSVDRATGVVTMDSDAKIGAAYPKRKGVIRVNDARVRWRIVPSKSGQLIIENYAHIDPNGNIPAWFSNIFIIDEPYKVLRRIRSVLETGSYDQAEVAFLALQKN